MHMQRVKKVRRILNQGYCPVELAVELCDSIEMLVEQRDKVYSAMYAVLKEKMRENLNLVESPHQDK